VPGESYTLFVDGYEGAVSEYIISVNCVEPQRLYLPLLLRD
jgi:hypothetical protein